MRWARPARRRACRRRARARSLVRVVGRSETLFGELAALHPLGEPDLFLHRQEIGFADLLAE